MPLRRKFIKHDAEGEHIGAVIHSFTLELLRRHVGHRSYKQARNGQRCVDRRGLHGRSQNFSQTEIQNLDPAIVNNHHILGLQIAMNNSGLMRGTETFADADEY